MSRVAPPLLPRRPIRNRRVLERAGWRTWIEYTENLVRNPDGVLLSVEPRWTAAAERDGERFLVASATAPSVVEAWARLRLAVWDVDSEQSALADRS